MCILGIIVAWLSSLCSPAEIPGCKVQEDWIHGFWHVKEYPIKLINGWVINHIPIVGMVAFPEEEE